MSEENRPAKDRQREPDQAEGRQEEKGTVDKLIDKAQEKGLADKAAKKAKDLFKGR